MTVGPAEQVTVPAADDEAAGGDAAVDRHEAAGTAGRGATGVPGREGISDVLAAVVAVAGGATASTARPAAAVDALVTAVGARALETALLPGAATRDRWRLLGGVARADLCCARLVEGHLDAAAILAEADQADRRAWDPGARWGVWAAHPPSATLRAEHVPSGDGGPGEDAGGSVEGGRSWVLTGTKPWCSGSTTLTHALVSADTDEGRRLFAVVLDRSGPLEVLPTWMAVGMRDSDSNDVRFDGVPAAPVGPPGWYVERAGFAAGGVGVAACWLGGARGIADALWRRASAGTADPHALAHLGAVTAELAAADALLDAEAARLDAEAVGLDAGSAADLPPTVRAAVIRTVAARVADEVRERVGRALGPTPLCLDAVHAQRVADLEVYVRQHHAERDHAALGRDAAALAEPPWPV